MSKTKSIVTDYAGICFFCGKPAECEHHLLFGNGIRELADFVAYGAAAEFAEKYFKKSTKLVVVARCQTRTYTNNEGKKVYVTEFIVEDQEFAESKRAAGGEPETEKDGFMQMPEGEELPFN